MSSSTTVTPQNVEEISKRPIVISGPSGAGKSTLLKRLFDDHPGQFGFSVSHTTRSPRPGESNGIQYHFVTRTEFEDLIKQDAFIEHAQFSGNYYGTSIRAVEDVAKVGGRRCVLDIDSQGVKSLKHHPNPTLHPLYIFLAPPSVSSLRARLTSRGTETPESLERRLSAAKGEIEYAQKGNFDLVVVNDDLDRAYGVLKGVCVDGKSEGDRLPEGILDD